MNGIILIIVLLSLASFVQYFRDQIMKLGNLIERITYYTGIKYLVKKIWGDDCGCDERQDKLNDIELW